MMKKGLLLLFSVLFMISCQQDDPLRENPALPDADKLELDHFILQTIKDTDAPFDWNTASNETVMKGLKVTDGILVIGYGDGVTNLESQREAILSEVALSEGISEEEALVYHDDVLGFMSVRVSKMETLELLRSHSAVQFLELNGYPMDYELMLEYADKPATQQPAHRNQQAVQLPDMILDPYLDDPDYPVQVNNYDDGLYNVIHRHRLDEVYRTYGIYGEDIGVAVIDNGVVPWARELFEANGYGGRELLGFYNPWWFLPWTEPDGTEPRSSDVFGISELFEGQWLHGSGMMQSVLVVAPNADITCIRASTAIIILVHDQILGISNAIRAMADRPDIRVTNMSMGTIFMLHRVKNAINYYHSKGKIITCAAGTTPEEIKDLLGIIFPAYLGNTISVTGIRNRETNGGIFEAGSTAHTGPQNDFCVEASAASSEATARMAGMFAVLWSANPDLTREEVMDIMITSSYFYNELGMKDPEFGWGTVDMMEAVGKALE